MISTNLSHTELFLAEKKHLEADKRAREALDMIKKRSGPGNEWLGWRDLVADPNDAVLSKIDALAEKIREDADVFIVCGIGGSYLGARAVIDALSPAFPVEDDVEVLYAGHQISGSYLEQLIQYLEKSKADGSSKSVYLNVISKSGTTLETALAFRVLREWMNNNFEDADKRIICTTSAEGGALNKLVDEHGYEKFVIPNDVGGRYSVLTPVGLLPIAVAGIDIQTLFYGAVNEYEKLEEDPGPIINHAAVRYTLYQQGRVLDLISSFEPELYSIERWLQQLLGESEGKSGEGVFPVVAAYSTDLHSIGQMVQQGQRNLMETFITVKQPHTNLKLKEQEDNGDGLNYLAGKSFHEINSRAYEGTRKAHVEGDVPIISVELEKLNAQHIGAFLYYFELFTAVYVYCVGVNPFNQPGVEDYKKAMYSLLGKPGA